MSIEVSKYLGEEPLYNIETICQNIINGPPLDYNDFVVTKLVEWISFCKRADSDFIYHFAVLPYFLNRLKKEIIETMKKYGYKCHVINDNREILDIKILKDNGFTQVSILPGDCYVNNYSITVMILH
jgi:hypothetical protein